MATSTLILTFLVFLPPELMAWDLAPLVDNIQYNLLHISVYHGRSFLSIATINKTSISSVPTLIESTWPESAAFTSTAKTKRFILAGGHARIDSDCSRLIQAIGTSVDQSRRIWVLDNGSKYCRPKVFVVPISNKRRDDVLQYAFKKFSGGSFAAIQTDPDGDNRALLTLRNHDYVVVYSLNDCSWWKLRIRTNELFLPCGFIAPKEIVFRAYNRVFIVDQNDDLYTARLDLSHRFHCNRAAIIASHRIGKLLGNCTAMTIDPNEFLYYYLPRDGAVVRWNPHKTLTAEGHDVLEMSSRQIAQIITDSKGTVWAVTSVANENEQHCQKLLHHYKNTVIE